MEFVARGLRNPYTNKVITFAPWCWAAVWLFENFKGGTLLGLAFPMELVLSLLITSVIYAYSVRRMLVVCIYCNMPLVISEDWWCCVQAVLNVFHVGIYSYIHYTVGIALVLLYCTCTVQWIVYQNPKLGTQLYAINQI